jgi:serine phosphatase RsbU (regulator of sigma subunit)
VPKLIIRNGPRKGTEFILEESMVIGRGPAADLSVDDPSVSRRHAELTWANAECFVVDLGSDNGTLVNGIRIATPTCLGDGDQLTVGSLTADYRVRDVGPDVTGAESPGDHTENAPHQSVSLTMAADPTGGDASGLAAKDTTSVLSRRFQFLNDLGGVINQTFDESALLAFVLDRLLTLLPQADRSFIMLWNEDAGQLVPTAARTRSGDAPPEVAVSRTLLDDVVQKREAILVIDSSSNRRYADRESIVNLRMRSAICVPMIFHDEIYGVIQVDSTASAAPFKKADMSLLLGIAAQVGMSLAYATLHAKVVERELLEQDMALAQRIQRQFLPGRTPDIEGYSFAAHYSPALAIGGDLYDFLDLPDENIGIVVGDASGKGVSAALYAAKLSSDVRYLSAGQIEPARILHQANEVLSTGSQEGMFATLALIILDLQRSRMVVSSAGHLLPFVRDARGQVQTVGHAGDAPMGLSERSTFQQHTYRLEPADSVVLYTDGVTEASNADDEIFGEERLVEAIRQSDGSAEGLLQSILLAVKRFAGDTPQSDDLTVLCFRRDPSDSSSR